MNELYCINRILTFLVIVKNNLKMLQNIWTLTHNNGFVMNNEVNSIYAAVYRYILSAIFNYVWSTKRPKS